MPSSRRALTYGLTANVVILSVVSLLTDVSSEMILPILPFFLTQVLAADVFIVGLIEGLSESAVSFMKLLAGRISDSAGRRKAFVAAGYGLSSTMKALFPFARAWPEFLGMRVLERTGKGVRDAPRDALLVESTPAETRGKAFGFHRSMDTAGAIAGLEPGLYHFCPGDFVLRRLRSGQPGAVRGGQIDHHPHRIVALERELHSGPRWSTMIAGPPPLRQ